MKKLVFLLFLFQAVVLTAQKADTTNVRSPKIICNVPVGEFAGFGDHAIKFIQVISDSRCPKNVTCVWAGEAKVQIEIYEGGKLIETKEVVITPGTEITPLISLKKNSIGVYDLSPYPQDNTPIKKEQYVLNLIVTQASE